MTNYVNRVNVENKFKIVSPDLADMIVATMGNMPQGGAIYHKGIKGAVVYQSDSAKDLIDAMSNGFWDHGASLNKVEKGTIVYIVTNKPTRTSLGNNIVLEGVATGPMIKLESTDVRAWTTAIANDENELLDDAVAAEAAKSNQ